VPILENLAPGASFSTIDLGPALSRPSGNAGDERWETSDAKRPEIADGPSIDPLATGGSTAPSGIVNVTGASATEY
jgi:hypothetical protein